MAWLSTIGAPPAGGLVHGVRLEELSWFSLVAGLTRCTTTCLLDVSMIVGPPYAITKCSPIIGPVDGGTELIIEGMGFEDAATTVRFSFGKGEDSFADATGEYISPSQIKVITPDFEEKEFGPKKVDVRLSQKGDAMTTTKTSFQFFENTKAENCVVYGPGTNPVCSTQGPVAIVIQAVDGAGAMRDSGLDNSMSRS